MARISSLHYIQHHKHKPPSIRLVIFGIILLVTIEWIVHLARG